MRKDLFPPLLRLIKSEVPKPQFLCVLLATLTTDQRIIFQRVVYEMAMEQLTNVNTILILSQFTTNRGCDDGRSGLIRVFESAEMTDLLLHVSQTAEDASLDDQKRELYILLMEWAAPKIALSIRVHQRLLKDLVQLQQSMLSDADVQPTAFSQRIEEIRQSIEICKGTLKTLLPL